MAFPVRRDRTTGVARLPRANPVKREHTVAQLRALPRIEEGRYSIGAVLALNLVLTAVVLALSDGGCEALFERERDSSLKLSYEAFDQTEGQGFRVLAAAGCPRQAGDLIEAYLKSTSANQKSLRWHLALMRAESGETKAAIAAARMSLRSEDSPEAALCWNDFVRAVIAFWEHDREAFDRHRRAVSEARSEHAGNEANVLLLERLARHFVLPYDQAPHRP